MNKYTKHSVKTNESKKTWHCFVATNKTITERFRVTKELHELIDAKIKNLGITKSQYLTDLVLMDCGYKESIGKELVYGVDWVLE